MKKSFRSSDIQYDETIKEFGFSQNPDKPCVYKKVSGCVIIFLILYVDDILIIGNDISKLHYVNVFVIQEFLHERTWRSNVIFRDIDL